MGQLRVDSHDEFYGIQDRLPREIVRKISYNKETMTINWTDTSVNSVISRAARDEEKGEPMPVVDPHAVSKRLVKAEKSLVAVKKEATKHDARITAAETLLATHTAQIADILSTYQSFAQSFADVVAGWRAWSPIPGVPDVTVSANMAGSWVYSMYAYDEVGGLPIAVRIKKNGEVMAANSVTGTDQIDESSSNIAVVVEVLEGDVLTFEIGHDIEDVATLSGRINGAMLF